MSLFYSTSISIVQHRHHYSIEQTALSYSTNITISQHKYLYCTTHTHSHTYMYVYILSTDVSILHHKRPYFKHKKHYCTAQTNLFYSTIITIVQHSFHYCTANLSLLYSTNITIVHHNIIILQQTTLFYSTKRRIYYY